MCYFITLVLSPSAEAPLAKLLEPHRRQPLRVSNAALARVAPDGDAQFFTTRTCDCGTVLGVQSATPEELAAEREKQVARLRRRGWTEAKICRSLADSAAGRATTTHRPPTDSHGLWAGVIEALLGEVPRVGIFVHSYSKGIETEQLEPRLRRAPRNIGVGAALRSLQDDELLLFEASRKAG